MRLHVGTSGFSYKAWKGPFYPEKLADRKMLAFYAERLSTVEVNNTFYRLPRPELLERWAGEVPEGFVFVIKATRRITHDKRLADVAEPLELLWGATESLGPHRGPILFQLPPSFRADAARLEAFLELLPPDCRAAFEFRHPSWEADEVRALLERFGAALCIADTDEKADPRIDATASWGYLRLRRSAYTQEELVSWAQRVRSQPWQEAFVFFKHEDEGAAPRMANEFRTAFEASS